VLEAIEAELGIRAGEETPDGAFSLEVASDVGAGSLSPAFRIDTLVYGPMDPDKARHVVQERRKAATRKRAAAVPS
jgi:NADH-quinone oxidoreductase subunit E